MLQLNVILGMILLRVRIHVETIETFLKSETFFLLTLFQINDINSNPIWCICLRAKWIRYWLQHLCLDCWLREWFHLMIGCWIDCFVNKTKMINRRLRHKSINFLRVDRICVIDIESISIYNIASWNLIQFDEN